MLFLQPANVRSQGTARGSDAAQGGIDLAELLTRFRAAAEECEKTFRSLTAEETKLIEVYNASGELEKRRQIVSDLLVYHSSRSATDATTEYRDVRMVDGKTVAKRGERALKLLTNASRADSLDKELEAINRETFAYEFKRHLRGFTIDQGGVLQRWWSAFQVELVGRDHVAGHDVVVLDYRQTAPIPGFRLPVPKEFGNPSPVHRGRLWLDAQTGQLWRYVWELAWPHPATPEPLVMIRQENTYGPSAFGILVPVRIVWDWRTHFSYPKNGQPSFALSERTTFTYSSFKRFDVATDVRVKIPEARDR